MKRIKEQKRVTNQIEAKEGMSCGTCKIRGNCDTVKYIATEDLFAYICGKYRNDEKGCFA